MYEVDCVHLKTKFQKHIFSSSEVTQVHRESGICQCCPIHYESNVMNYLAREKQLKEMMYYLNAWTECLCTSNNFTGVIHLLSEGIGHVVLRSHILPLKL